MAASEAGEAFVNFLWSAGLPEKLWSVLLQKVECGQLGVDGQLKVLQESTSPYADSTMVKSHNKHDVRLWGRQCRETEWTR